MTPGVILILVFNLEADRRRPLTAAVIAIGNYKSAVSDLRHILTLPPG